MESNSYKFLSELKEIEREYNEIMSRVEMVEVASDIKLLRFYQRRLRELEPVALAYKKYRALLGDMEQRAESECTEPSSKLKDECEQALSAAKGELERLSVRPRQRARVEISLKDCEPRYLGEFIDYIKSYATACDYLLTEEERGERGAKLTICGAGASDALKKFVGEVKFVERARVNSLLFVAIESSDREFGFSESDVIFQISRSSGAGGQHINKTETNVKAVHLPTGLSAECEQNRSQLQNKQAALHSLKAKVEKYFEENEQKNQKIQRKEMKNAIFGGTPSLIFDYDKNEVTFVPTKSTKKLSEVRANSIKILL